PAAAPAEGLGELLRALAPIRPGDDREHQDVLAAGDRGSRIEGERLGVDRRLPDSEEALGRGPAAERPPPGEPHNADAVGLPAGLGSRPRFLGGGRRGGRGLPERGGAMGRAAAPAGEGLPGPAVAAGAAAGGISRGPFSRIAPWSGPKRAARPASTP